MNLMNRNIPKKDSVRIYINIIHDDIYCGLIGDPTFAPVTILLQQVTSPTIKS